MLLSAIVLAVSILIIMLIVSCIALVKDCNDAQEDLHQTIEQFYRVALSVKDADGESARMAYRRAQPFRQILLQASDDAR
jgi:hypothetical protein